MHLGGASSLRPLACWPAPHWAGDLPGHQEAGLRQEAPDCHHHRAAPPLHARQRSGCVQAGTMRQWNSMRLLVALVAALCPSPCVPFPWLLSSVSLWCYQLMADVQALTPHCCHGPSAAQTSCSWLWSGTSMPRRRTCWRRCSSCPPTSSRTCTSPRWRSSRWVLAAAACNEWREQLLAAGDCQQSSSRCKLRCTGPLRAPRFLDCLQAATLPGLPLSAALPPGPHDGAGEEPADQHAARV